jgi:DNA repair protein RAD50
LTAELNSFVSDVSNLKELSKQVDEYMASDTEKDLSQISSKRDTIVEKMKAKEAEIRKMQPDVDRLNKAVADQENHKKNLAENIDLIHSGQRIDELEKEIAALDEEAGKVEGSDACNEDWDRVAERKQVLLSAQARLEGRRGEIVESVRSLKVSPSFEYDLLAPISFSPIGLRPFLQRKLSTPEYKNVDEEHRVAMIKHETTQMAVRDIDKYYNALDQVRITFFESPIIFSQRCNLLTLRDAIPSI